jgi:Flp pilus assembly protein TadG
MKRRLQSGHIQTPESHSESESGQALVEISVAMSLLTLILLGAVQFGQIMFTSIKVVNAAKAGVEYGAQTGFTAEDSTGISNAAKASASSLTGMTVNSSYTCACSDGTASTCLNTDCSASRIIETVSVTTQYKLTPIVHLPKMANSITLNGSAIQKCAQ